MIDYVYDLADSHPGRRTSWEDREQHTRVYSLLKQKYLDVNFTVVTDPAEIAKILKKQKQAKT